MVFIKRLGSSVALWAIILFVLFKLGNFASWAISVLVASIALAEFYDMLERRKLKTFKVGGLFGGFVLLTGSWWNGQFEPQFLATFEMLILLCFVIGVFLRQLPQEKNPEAIETISCTLLGLMYVPWLMSFVPKINYLYKLDGPGPLFVFYVVAVTKCSDIGAYLVGSSVGRHKMAERISPNKTWEGAFGGVICSLITSYSLFTIFEHVFAQVHFTQTHAIITGLLIGVVAILGDLSESLIKREANISDSGGLLPGIGGFLDLIDSLLFTTPVMYAYLVLVVNRNL